jgi:hypothetical protein
MRIGCESVRLVQAFSHDRTEDTRPLACYYWAACKGSGDPASSFPEPHFVRDDDLDRAAGSYSAEEKGANRASTSVFDQTSDHRAVQGIVNVSTPQAGRGGPVEGKRVFKAYHKRA